MGSHMKQGSKPLVHALRSHQALLTQQIQKMESLKILSQQSQSVKPRVWGLSECGALCDCDLRWFNWNCHRSRTREAHVISTVNTSVPNKYHIFVKKHAIGTHRMAQKRVWEGPRQASRRLIVGNA